MNNQTLSAIENRIQKIKEELMAIGEMRPGSLTKQQRQSPAGVLAYWQLSYTHKMKSRTSYVRPSNLRETRAQVKAFRKFKALVDRWVDLAIEHAKIKIKLKLEK